MVKRLDGKELRNKLTTSLQERVEKLDKTPKLVIIQVGDVKESGLYIKEKKDYGERLGIVVEHIQFPADVSEVDLLSDIHRFNQDEDVDGIIVQLPIPKGLNKDRVINAIKSKKDVDGLTQESMGRLARNQEGLIPATTKGILTLLESYGVEIKGERAVVVGESFLVGRPTALALLNRGATVTVCHADTKNLTKETKEADILITAVGQDDLITSEHVSEGQVVIDVGINLRGERVTGDVNFNEVKEIVEAITPVPGGVGPMTVFSLFENLLTVVEKGE